MAEKALYQTVVENAAGISGHAKVIQGGTLDVLTSNPIHDNPGTNPEQLIGVALATCLNATIEAEEKRRQLPHKSIVRVGVQMGFDNPGFQFWLDAQVKIPQVSHDEAVAILKKAESRCPVAKLLKNSENVTVHLVDHFNFNEEKEDKK